MAKVNQITNETTLKKAEIKVDPVKQELLITTEHDAPRDLVFKAYTDAKLFVQWMGPHELVTRLEKFEPRNGGTWRFVQKDNNGKEYRFHGVFHEVLAPERIIQTFEYEQLPEKGHVSLQTAKFEALPENRTRVVAQAVFQSIADRDGMIQSGMERGVNDGYNRLSELLEKMKK